MRTRSLPTAWSFFLVGLSSFLGSCLASAGFGSSFFGSSGFAGFDGGVDPPEGAVVPAGFSGMYVIQPLSSSAMRKLGTFSIVVTLPFDRSTIAREFLGAGF